MRIALFYALLLVLSTPLFSKPAKNLHEQEGSTVQKADLRLENLNKKIQQFLDETQTDLKNNEAHLRETGKWEKNLKNNTEFREDFKKLQEQFLAFRDSLMQVIVGNYSHSSYSRALQITMTLELTEWYATQIEEVILQEIRQGTNKKK